MLIIKNKMFVNKCHLTNQLYLTKFGNDLQGFCIFKGLPPTILGKHSPSDPQSAQRDVPKDKSVELAGFVQVKTK